MNAPIPARLNLFLLLIAPLATGGLLWLGSHGSLPVALGAALLFAFVAHLPFSLLHEAVHGVFSPNRRVNELAGTFAAALFPTSFTLQRVAHLGHHARNRTDLELYDYHLPHQSRLLRGLWLYGGNLLGLYWFCVPLSALLFFIFPGVVQSQWFVKGPAKQLGFGPYVADLAEASASRIWAECGLALAYQITLFFVLGLTWKGWLLCHGAFALHWSALQYVDHAYSPRDIVEGAWNLKVWAPVRWISLHYHLHLAHHRHPSLPWIHLPSAVRKEDPQPTFWQIYFRLWRGTRPAPPMGTGATFRPDASEG
jgi:fatty acid desaturase